MVILWVVALIRIKKSRLFECLVIGDNLISLFVFTMLATMLGDDYTAWDILIGLGVENVIMLCLIFYKRIKSRC